MSESIYSKELTDLLQELDIQPKQPDDEDIYGEWGRPLREAKPEKAKTPLLDRFMRNVEVDDGHWMWQGAEANGYGAIKVDSKVRYAHRVSWELFKGLIPAGYKIITCELRFCVNPSHLSTAPIRRSRGRVAHPQS